MPAHSFQAPTLIGCQIFKERIFGLSSCVLPANCCSYFAESLRILTSYYLLRILYRVQYYNIFFGYLLASTYLLDPKILLCANAATPYLIRYFPLSRLVSGAEQKIMTDLFVYVKLLCRKTLN